MIDYLTSEEGKEVLYLSVTFDPLAIQGESPNTRAMEWRRIPLGQHGKTTPLQDLEKVMRHFDELAPEAIFMLDEACRGMAEIVRAKRVPLKWDL